MNDYPPRLIEVDLPIRAISTHAGLDPTSHKLHPEDPLVAMEVYFIKIIGWVGAGEVPLNETERKIAQRLTSDYWLYVICHCAHRPQVILIQDPARLDWRPVVVVEHYKVSAA